MSERPSGDDDRSSDAREDLLDDERRYLLRYLLQRETASVGELTGVLAGRVATDEERLVGTEEGTELADRLTDDHLPALASAGVLERDGQEVRLAADERRLRDLLPRHEEPNEDAN